MMGQVVIDTPVSFDAAKLANSLIGYLRTKNNITENHFILENPHHEAHKVDGIPLGNFVYAWEKDADYTTYWKFKDLGLPPKGINKVFQTIRALETIR